jgi:chromosome partitioning protein
MAGIISMASAKGGCSKTTLSVGLGAELALMGVKVTVLDADLNQHATKFGEKAAITGFTVVGEVTETNVLGEIRKANETSDLVIVDLPGGSSMLALKAMQRSHLVVIPSQQSLLDARDAIKTVDQIEDASEACGRVIPRAILWSRVMQGFESRPAKKVRATVEGSGTPIFRAALLNRVSLQEMFLVGKALSQINVKDPGAANLKTIAEELMSRLEALAT